MTCIVALKSEDGKEVYLGADSAVSNQVQIRTMQDPKLVQHGEFGFALCGSPRIAQLLKYRFLPPPVEEAQDIHAYMCTHFVDALIVKRSG